MYPDLSSSSVPNANLISGKALWLSHGKYDNGSDRTIAYSHSNQTLTQPFSTEEGKDKRFLAEQFPDRIERFEPLIFY